MKKTVTSVLLLLTFLLTIGSVQAQDSTQCQAYFIHSQNGLEAELTDFSYPGTSEIVSWAWDFGDGATSIEQNTSHTYAEVGTYAITLAITGEDCNSIVTQEIIIATDTSGCNCPSIFDPVCVLTPNNGTIDFINECFALCEGYTVEQFVNCTVDTADWCEAFFGYEADFDNPLQTNFFDFSWTSTPVVTWAWDFGDGSTSTEQNPTHTYAEASVVNIATLTITTEDGCSSSTSMEVWFYTDPCNCDLTFNPVCVNIDGFELVFPNACEAECGGFADYNVCDTTWNIGDCSANFGYYQEDYNSLTVNFENYSYNNSAATNWSWDFGDGTTSTDQNPVHTYAEAGEYQVSLLVGSSNCMVSTTQGVYVGEFQFDGCQACFWPIQDSLGNDGLTYTFFDFSFGAASWSWDFGDGTTSTDQNPSHTYVNAGVYSVSLTINGENCESTFDLILDTEDDLFFNVSNPVDVNGAQALFIPVFGDNNSVYFKNQSTSSSSIVNTTYTFGDGKTSSADNVSHLFPAQKAYNVTLKIKDDVGTVSSFTGTIDLSNKSFVSTTNSSTSIVLSSPTIQEDGFGLTLSPNPVMNRLNIDFKMPTSGKYNIEIQSITGKSLYNKSFTDGAGQSHSTINVGNYPQGMYLVKLQVKNAYKTFRFVKK